MPGKETNPPNSSPPNLSSYSLLSLASPSSSSSSVLARLILILILTLKFTSNHYPNSIQSNPSIVSDPRKLPAYPVIANIVEGVKYPFLYALSDFGSLPDKPHKNIVRILKNKPFRKPDISVTIQDVLEKFRSEGKNGVVVDVGANVGMATFAAAVMGFPRVCDGIHLNRVGELVTLFDAASSDRLGNISFHKDQEVVHLMWIGICSFIYEPLCLSVCNLVTAFRRLVWLWFPRSVYNLILILDNSAVSATGAKLAFKSNEEVALLVKSIPLDEVVPELEPVLLIKIDVQGWEYHVLKGAAKILSRQAGEAPYLIYEEDERLLQASNSSFCYGFENQTTKRKSTRKQSETSNKQKNGCISLRSRWHCSGIRNTQSSAETGEQGHRFLKHLVALPWHHKAASRSIWSQRKRKAQTDEDYAKYSSRVQNPDEGNMILAPYY
ncbi:hypothetical protein Ancab_006884 [Ancistrocladus abbreviatus]